MKFALFEDGLPKGFWTEDVHGGRLLDDGSPNPDCRIPSDAVAISNEQWQDFLQHQGQRRWSGQEVVAYEAPPALLTTEAVNAERQRRISLPFTVAVSGVGTFAVDMTDQSRANIAGLTTLAMILQGQGSTAVMTAFRDANNVDHNLTPAQAIQMGVQAALHVDAIYKKSWALKALDPIPVDYQTDAYWQ